MEKFWSWLEFPSLSLRPSITLLFNCNAFLVTHDQGYKAKIAQTWPVKNRNQSVLAITVTKVRIFTLSMSGHILKNQQKGDWNGVVVAVMDPIMTTYSIFNATMGIESLARACIYTKHLSNFKTSNCVRQFYYDTLSIFSMFESIYRSCAYRAPTFY